MKLRKWTAIARPYTASIRAHLVLIVFASTLPILGFAAYLLVWNNTIQREQVELQLLNTARAARVTVDAEMQAAITTLETLRLTSALDTSDLDEFRRQARAVADQHQMWTGLILVEPDGQQVINLAAQPGQPLPNIADYEIFKRVLATGKPAVSELLVGRVLPQPLVGIEVPVFREGRIRYVLGTSLLISSLRDRLRQLVASPELLAGALDSKHIVAVRTDSEDVTRRTTLPWLSNAIRNQPEGIFYSLDDAGSRLAIAFNRSDLSGWTIFVWAPESYLENAANRSLRALYIGGAALVLSALLLTFLIVRRIERPVARLSAAADAYVRGMTDIPSMATGVHEVDKLAETLREAGLERRRLADERTQVLVEEERRERAESLAAQAQASEMQFRALADAMPVLLSYVGTDLCYRFANRTYEDWYGIPAERIRGMPARDLIGDEAMRQSQAYIDRALAGEVVRFEKPLALPGGDVRHVAIHYIPRRGAEGSVEGFYALLVDLTERKRAEDHRQLLLNELNHRVKNTLTTVQSVARQTARSASSFREFYEAFESRLLSLAETHDVLTRENWRGASLREIVQVSLSPWSVESGRFEVAGPDVRVSARIALALSMALHELATNAVKYGALSVPTGGVALTWEVEDRDSGRVVMLRWREQGGPPVMPPTRKGFGSRLLERGLPEELDGEVDLQYSSAGVQCAIRFTVGQETP